MSQTIDRPQRSGAPVVVERSVNRKDEGVTATYHVTAVGDDSVGVRIVQSLAGEAAVRDVGFHPEHAPTAWAQSDDAVVFDIATSDEVKVILGVAGDRDRVLPTDVNARVTAVDTGVDVDADEFLFGDPFAKEGWLGGVRRVLLGSGSDDDPDIDVLERTEDADVADGETTKADGEREGTAVEADDGDVSHEAVKTEDGITIEAAEPDASGEADDVPAWDDLDDAVERIEPDTADDIVIESAEHDAAEETEGESADLEMAEPADGETVVDADAAAVETETETESGDAELTETTDDMMDTNAATERVDAEPAEVEAASEAETTGVAEAADGGTTSVSAEAADASAIAESDEVEATVESDARSVAERLAAEIEADEVDEETMAVLREYMRIENGTADVRLRHIQSRMSDFEAYAAALEDTIETHGTASPFMDRTTTKLDDLDDALESVEERVDEGAVAHDELTDGVDTLAAEVDDLRASLDTLEKEVADVRNSHETRFRRLEDDVDMLATDVREMRESLDSEVQSLEADLAEMRDFRQNLSAAFSAGPNTEE